MPSRSIETAALDAYAAGWALSGGPMTPRVKAGCAAAVAMAREHADDPRILEVTLKLGSLEGTWAQVFDRRDQLAAAHTAVVTAIWRQLVHGHLRTAVRAFRHACAIAETADKPDPTRFKAAALDAARVLLGALALDHAWDKLRRALRNAIAAGRAEGAVDAIAVAAERVGRIGLDWDIAFDDAYRALANLGDIWADTDGWLGRMLDRAAADLGRALSDGAASGASYEDMVADALDSLDSEDVSAVKFVVDWALNTGLARGALDLYAREGVEQVSWLTAADDRVCVQCLTNEDNSPYPINSFPNMPAHPLCVVGITRVSVPTTSAAGPVPASAATESDVGFGQREILAVSERYYVGDVIVIRTAAGHELTATPNHPIATRCGWIPIADLRMGDHVLSSTRPEWVLAGVDPDVDNVPPAIEQVAKAFSVTFGPMPTSAEDFHGDGAGSKVHVVRADRFLRDDVTTKSPDIGSEFEFCRGHVSIDTTLAGRSSSIEMPFGSLGSSRSSMRGRGDASTLVGGSSRHPGVHCITSVTRHNACPQEMSPDNSAVDTERKSESLLTFAGNVPLHQLAGVDHLREATRSDLAAGFDGHPPFAQPVGDRVLADTEGFCQRNLALASDVTTDEIIDVERFAWSGHVYNLDTSGGWYVANGILTHNCRCAPSAELALTDAYDPYFTAA